jgi:hypothetical protein
MVQHNDKWTKKAAREYHKKHGLPLPVRGRGRGRGRGCDGPEPAEETHSSGEEEEALQSGEDTEEPQNEEELSRRVPSKYSRRKIESNAWRFAADEPPDPHIGIPSSVPTNKVIDESMFEPPEPDYAHLPAREFGTKPRQGTLTKAPHRKKYTVKESELAPMRAQIEKANAARAFKDRFSNHTANIVRISEDGTARRQLKKAQEKAEEDEIDDIDDFLAELDMNDPVRGNNLSSTSRPPRASKQESRAELDSFVDSLI